MIELKHAIERVLDKYTVHKFTDALDVGNSFYSLIIVKYVRTENKTFVRVLRGHRHQIWWLEDQKEPWLKIQGLAILDV